MSIAEVSARDESSLFDHVIEMLPCSFESTSLISGNGSTESAKFAQTGNEGTQVICTFVRCIY